MNLMAADATEVMATEVERVKAELLQVPISAHAKACRYRDVARQAGQEHTAVLYDAVIASLAADGYAPDPATGQPGPAVREHYEVGVLQTDTAQQRYQESSVFGPAAGEGDTPSPESGV